MSEFQFQKSQRVIVPADVACAENVQGVIVGYSSRIGYEPDYTIAWPSADAVDGNGFLKTIERSVGQSALDKAQPPKMVTAAEAQKIAGEAYDKGGADVREEIEMECQARIGKRKASRKAAARKRTR
jgi:hypothetical protein